MKSVTSSNITTSVDSASLRITSSVSARMMCGILTVVHFFEPIQKINRVTKAYQHLSQLSDIQLAEHGIRREDILRVLLRRFYGIK